MGNRCQRQILQKIQTGVIISGIHEQLLLHKDKKVQECDARGDAIKNYSRYHKN